MYEPNDDVRPAGAEVDEFDDAPPDDQAERKRDRTPPRNGESERTRSHGDSDETPDGSNTAE
jgi:hypothetical protein